MLTFKAKMAGNNGDNNGTDKNPNEPQQNYHIIKVNKPPHNEIRKASPNEFK